ncbi:hypothetical protein PoB_000784200 [Plakobranchus ocellatus]|uniref:PiggyBac transposable element-derived protein domain-containing protein n=1 Tax=Plakobranchus ocellatus TaxID=259542 RepID=A0AAV3YGI6_9GAST|nr:hypothetical protein PoB_000784200 [Plakobranchus ocellatus]
MIYPNRKGWPITNTKKNPGKIRMMQKGRMVAVQWTDKRLVNILSTNTDPKKDGDSKEKDKALSGAGLSTQACGTIQFSHVWCQPE